MIKISGRLPMESQKQRSTIEKLLLSLANCLKGQSLSATSTGNVATIRKSLEAFCDSARYHNIIERAYMNLKVGVRYVRLTIAYMRPWDLAFEIKE